MVDNGGDARHEALEAALAAVENQVRVGQRSLKNSAEKLAAAERREARAVFLAEHLFQMIPQEVWRATGGDDGQGHYEGDYRAEQIREELRALAARAEGQT